MLVRVSHPSPFWFLTPEIPCFSQRVEALGSPAATLKGAKGPLAVLYAPCPVTEYLVRT